MDRRTIALDAALTVIGREGMRALTHRAVDAEAGFPPGTTSNHFRTRHALLDGALGRLIQRDLADLSVPGTPPTSTSELAQALVGYVRHAAGPSATLTRARYALFLEVAGDPALGAAVAHHRAQLHERTVGLLSGLAAPERACALAAVLMAAMDGVILHRITGAGVGPDVDAALQQVLIAALNGAQEIKR